MFEYNGVRYPVHLRTVLPNIHTETDSREVRLDFVERSAELGAAGRLLSSDNVIHIPAELLVKRGEQTGVFINQSGIAHFHALQNAQDGRPAAVNLPADTHIIVTGQFALNEGAAIKSESTPSKDNH